MKSGVDRKGKSEMKSRSLKCRVDGKENSAWKWRSLKYGVDVIVKNAGK